jgi:NAD(P)-dependent dehydrogenase (short-subunit alcohol dehydrogenase family)
VNPDPRVVLVTGASSGIGRAVAVAVSEDGDHLVLASRDESALHRVARLCEKAGAASALVIPTDVGDDAAVARCFERALERHGRLGAVVHCAAVLAYGRTERIPAEVFDAVLRTNLTGSVNVVRHAVAQMRVQQHGTIVLVGSIAGHVASPHMSPYVLSKWGTRALARQLAIENRDMDDVRIVYIAPGGVDTPIYEQAANYHGYAGRPPPPIASPEKVARTIVRRLDGRGRRRAHTAWTNHPIRVGFTALPRLFDAMANPFFRFVVSDRTRRVETTTGNVFQPVESLERTQGGQGGPWVAIAKNVVATATQRRRGARER